MKKRVLCVEQNYSLGFVVKTVLSNSFDVVLVYNIFDAMEKLQQHEYNCILLAIEKNNPLPAALLQHLRSSSLYKNIPVVVLSDHESENLVAMCNDFEIADFFKKPYNPLHLLDAVKSICQPVDTSQILFKRTKSINLN